MRPAARTFSLITAAHPLSLGHLAETARSVAAQRLPAGWQIEWCAWADGDSDEQLRGCLAGVRSVPGLAVLIGNTSRHMGPAACRNIALAHATGELVRQLDADDLLLPDAIADDIGQMSDLGLAFCCSGTQNVDDSGEMWPWEGVPEEGYIERRQLYEWWAAGEGLAEIHNGTVCARTELLRLIGGWMDMWPNEDAAVLVMLGELGRGHYRRKHSHVYRFWDGSSTADFDVDTLAQDERLLSTAAAIRQRLAVWRRYCGDAQWAGASDTGTCTG
jgi:hypothetical protein